MNQYVHEINKKVKKAIDIVKEYREQHPDADDLAIVFDIDGTLLNEDKPIKPVVHFYNLCKQLGYTTFIVTARDSYGIGETINQLHGMGINGFHSAYFRAPSVWNISKFKESCRRSIGKKGYQVVLSIGDSNWDVCTHLEGDSCHNILLPQLGF